MKNNGIFICVCVIAVITGCSSKDEQSTEMNAETEQVLHLSAAQQRRLNVEVSQPQYRTVSKYIEASGQLDVPPQHLITISAPLEAL